MAMAMAMAASSSTAAYYPFDVFICHRGPDVKKTFASHLYRCLSKSGLRAFLNQADLQQGDSSTVQIIDAVRTASIHVVVFSPNYAESNWCLYELLLMQNYGKTIIPVFYHVTPAEVRWTSGNNGKYAEDLQRLARKSYEGKCGDESDTVEKWRRALSSVADISGFVLEECNGDEGELVDKVVKCVLKRLEPKFDENKFNVFISHRGPEVTKTFASHLYRALLKTGLKVFLDQPELQRGDSLTAQIFDAIKTAPIHVAVFSPRYAESSWCLNELLLMLESGKPIIPVFYHVAPHELRWTKGKYAKALQILAKKRTNGKCRYEPNTIKNWKNALSSVADISGFELKACNGDEGELVDNVVRCVLEKVKGIAPGFG